jgi:hypothetical protein
MIVVSNSHICQRETLAVLAAQYKGQHRLPESRHQQQYAMIDFQRNTPLNLAGRWHAKLHQKDMPAAEHKKRQCSMLVLKEQPSLWQETTEPVKCPDTDKTSSATASCGTLCKLKMPAQCTSQVAGT